MVNRWLAPVSIVLVAILSLVLAICVGSASFSPGEVLDFLFADRAEPSWQRTVLFDLRLPRSLVAAIAGGGLAASGTSLQGLFRNPMADPGILGVSGGAAFGAVTAMYLGPQEGSLVYVPIAAFAGALACSAMVYLLASSRGHASTHALLLAGVAVGGIAAAATTLVLSLALSNWELGRQMTSWLMGGLEGRGWTHVGVVSPIVLVGIVALMAYARDLNVLAMGEEGALGLGVDVPRVRRIVIALASLITAATVSVMGVVSFVGLVVPHALRLLVGPDHKRLLPLSFFAGAVVLVWADTLCRVLAPHHDVRLGVITALLGGPFFLFLLVRRRRAAERM